MDPIAIYRVDLISPIHAKSRYQPGEGAPSLRDNIQAGICSMWTARGRDPFSFDYRLQLDANDDTNAAMVKNDPGLVSHFTWPGTTVAPRAPKKCHSYLSRTTGHGINRQACRQSRLS
jgi:hypothetical protein